MTDRPHPAFSGYRMIWISGFALFLATPAQSYGFAVFVEPMITEFGWPRSLISSAYTIGTLAATLAVLLAGRVVDRVGQRQVMIAAGVVYVVALLLLSVVTGPITLVLGFTLARVSGGSVLLLASRTLIAQWFRLRRGRAVSLINVGKTLGMAAMPVANVALIATIGWRDTWRINALAAALLIPIAWWWVRDRPEAIGQHPDGREPFHHQSRPPTNASSERSPATALPDEPNWTLREALRTRTMWILLAAGFIPAFVTNGLSFHHIGLMAERGFSTAAAATAFAVESMVAVPMTLLAGWLIDRYGVRPMLLVAQIVLIATVGWLLVPGSPSAAIGYGVLRGLTTGTWFIASEVSWPAYFGRRSLGAIFGVSYAVAFAGAALGPLPFGVIFDITGSFSSALWIMIGLGALMAVAVTGVTPPDNERQSATRQP